MTLLNLSSKISDPLQVEIDAIELTREDLYNKLLQSDVPCQYFNSFTKQIYGKEFTSRIDNFSKNRNLKILDIGFGHGESSLYLAHKGHTVHALEPSPLSTSILSQASAKFDLPIHIYQGTAEDINHIPESDFDLCLFNSSLHHCDDPIKALTHCLHKIHSKGKVIAFNEPILKFYQTRRWFNKMLITDPVRIGHYGGNEHIYSYREYCSLFKKAGFKKVAGFHNIRHQYPRETIRFDLDKKIDNKYMMSDAKIICKYLIMLVLKKALKKERGSVQAILKHLSLVPITFEAAP